MKNILTIMLLVALCSACSSGQKNTNANLFKKGITEIVTTYPNFIDKIEIKYDDWNRMEALIDDNDSILIEYDENNVPIKLSSFYNNELEFYETLNWFTDSLHITKLVIEGNESIETQKETYIFNENKEMTGIFRYMKDSLGNWKKRGSKYEFYWQDGNLMTIKNFIPVEITMLDSIKIHENEDYSIIELDELSNQIIKEGYTLFYESSYTYDDKNNPYLNTSLSQLVLPYRHNISKNNPVKIEKKYSDGETIIQNLSNEYNDNDFLTKSLIKVAIPLENTDIVEMTREFKY